MAVVLDSSALIAFIKEEPGADFVEDRLSAAIVSAVNVQEVAKKMIEAGLPLENVRRIIGELKLEVRSHNIEDAYLAASLASATRKFGLGDRSCMALAIKLGVPAITTDRLWAQLDIPGLEVILAR